MADARFLAEHWPHPRWQPLWYGGTRFDYVFPPLVRYGSASLSRALSVSPMRGYRIFTGFFFCIGIAAVYVFIRTVSGSRVFGWLGAAVVALVSPASLMASQARADQLELAPQRISELVRGGQGLHMTALAILPLALAASYVALERGRRGFPVLAAILCALAISADLNGALSLIVLFLMLSWALWITHLDNGIWRRALLIGVLTFGLTAFWLTPSYLLVTVRNMNFSFLHANLWSPWIALAFANVWVWGSSRLVRGRRELAYPLFLSGAAWLFGLCVLAGKVINFRLVGEPAEWTVEFRLIVILAAVEVLRRIWKQGRLARAGVVGAILIAAAASRTYVRHPWILYQHNPDLRQRIEYQLPEWMSENHPGARSMVTGSVRFWYDTWHDLAQMGELIEPGMANPILREAFWNILQDEKPEMPVLWMQALGVDAVAVHDDNSQEIFRDYTNPRKFAGVLPVLWDSRRGDTIYQVPRRYPGLARVVNARTAASLVPPSGGGDSVHLRAYVDLVESGSQARTEWESPDAMRIQANVRDGEAIAVQVTYDPYWRAWSGGKRLAVRKDSLGQMLVEALPGENLIRLEFAFPWENITGWFLTALSAAAALGLLVWRRRQ